MPRVRLHDDRSDVLRPGRHRVTRADDVEGSDLARPQFIIDDEPKRNRVRFPRVPVDVDQLGEPLQGQPVDAVVCPFQDVLVDRLHGQRPCPRRLRSASVIRTENT
jgi:hypothetical protein